MKRNMGTADRAIRIIAACTLVVLYFTGTVTGTWGAVFFILGSIFLVTSLVGWCPLYALFGINTCPANTTAKKV